jgi:hypothetical protein
MLSGFPPIHRSSGLYLAWIGSLCGTIVLLLGDLFPFPLTFATPSAFFLSLVQIEVFFALLVWPLFVPSLQKDGIQGLPLFASILVLLVFALPLLLIGANVSNVGAAELIAAQAQVFGLAALGGGIASRRPGAMPWYLLSVFLLSTLPPLGFFLSGELGSKVNPSAASWFSPFWAAAKGGAAAWFQAGFGTLAGLGLLVTKDKAPA